MTRKLLHFNDLPKIQGIQYRNTEWPVRNDCMMWNGTQWLYVQEGLSDEPAAGCLLDDPTQWYVSGGKALTEEDLLEC